MALTIHVFLKDLRRCRLLLAGWLLLVALHYGALFADAVAAGYSHPVLDGIAQVEPTLEAILAIVLVAFLVQEEPLASSTGWWLTRPLPRPSVLRAKLLFGLILVAIPLAAELAVMVGAGVAGHDLIRAVPEIVLEKLQLLLTAAVLAAVTPNFTRFALLGAGYLVLSNIVGQAVGAWIARTADFSNGWSLAETLVQSRTLVATVVAVAGMGAALIYQYRTRRTCRALLAGAGVALAVLLIGMAWPYDFFPARPALRPTLVVDPAALHLTLRETQVEDLSNGQDRQRKNVNGQLWVEGIPRGYVALPRRSQARLTTRDGQLVPTLPARASNYIYEPRVPLFEAALGQVFVYTGRYSGSLMPSGLARMDTPVFQQHAQETLTLSDTLDFDVSHFVILGRMPLTKGAETVQGSEHVRIADLLRVGTGVDIILRRRDVDLLLKAPRETHSGRYLVSLPYGLGDATFVLVNRATQEVVLSKMNGARQIEQPVANGRLREDAWQLSFGPERYALTPKLDEAWLAQAELVELTLQPAAEVTVKLQADRFVLGSSNQSHTPQPPEPPKDPSWLTRFVLPPGADKAQMHAYVYNVLAASQYWHADTFATLPVAMLAKVGPGNVDVLIDEMDQFGPGLEQNLLLAAALRSAGPQDKGAVLGALKANPGLVDLVNKFGWQRDARAVLLAKLADEKETSLPRGWITAVATLHDPATYPALQSYLVRTPRRATTYAAIKDLPGLSLRATVAAAWRAAQASRDERVDAAAMAIDWGYPDALDALVTVLREDDPSEPRQLATAVRLVRRHTLARGEPPELISWYDANRDHLVFDPGSHRFRPKI